MSCNIGTGSGSKVVNDIKVGISTSATKIISKVLRWDNVVLWQRAKALTATNTRFTVDTTGCSKTDSNKSWTYSLTPKPYKTAIGDGMIEYNNGTSWITLYEDVDYSLRWTDNTGTLTQETSGQTSTTKGKVYIEGKGNYSGSFYQEFTISYTYQKVQTDISGCTVNLAESSKTLTNDDAAYTASTTEMQISVSSVYLGSTLLTLTTDYTVAYTYTDGRSFNHSSEGTLSNTVTVTITGVNNYKGTKSVTYEVYHTYVAGVSLLCAFNPSSTSVALFKDGASSYVSKTMTNGNIIGKAWNGSRNIIANENNTITTKNGSSFGTEVASFAIFGAQAIGSVGGKFIGFSYIYSNASHAFSSSDGTTWTRTDFDTEGKSGTVNMTAAVSGGGYAVAVGVNKTSKLLGFVRTDGTSYYGSAQSLTSDSAVCFGLCYSNGSFVIATNEISTTSYIRKLSTSGTAFGDPIGIECSVGTSRFHFRVDGNTAPRRIASNGGSTIVCVGTFGTNMGVATSTDGGSTWTGQKFQDATGGAQAMLTVAYAGAFYIFYTLHSESYGTVHVKKSTDGLTWSDVTSPGFGSGYTCVE